MRDIAKGDPANISYGNKSNLSLLKTYGFVDSEFIDEDPVLLFSVSVIPDDPLFELK